MSSINDNQTRKFNDLDQAARDTNQPGGFNTSDFDAKMNERTRAGQGVSDADNSGRQAFAGSGNAGQAYKPSDYDANLTQSSDTKRGPEHHLHRDEETLPKPGAGGNTYDYSADKMNKTQLPPSEGGNTQFTDPVNRSLPQDPTRNQPGQTQTSGMGYDVSHFGPDKYSEMHPSSGAPGTDTDKQFSGAHNTDLDRVPDSGTGPGQSNQPTHFQHSLAGQKVGLPEDQDRVGHTGTGTGIGGTGTGPGTQTETMRDTIEQHTGPHPNIASQGQKYDDTTTAGQHTGPHHHVASQGQKYGDTTGQHTGPHHNVPSQGQQYDPATTTNAPGKASTLDKLIGKTEKAMGKMTGDERLREQGAERAQTGLTKN